VGLWTYGFESTQGVLTKNETRRVRPVGDYVGPRAGASRRTVEHIDVCYRYAVGAVTFDSCRIGAGVSHVTLSPLAREPWEQLRPGATVGVYYHRQHPNIAVLHRGPDWMMVGGLAVLGFLFWFAARKIQPSESLSASASKARRARRHR